MASKEINSAAAQLRETVRAANLSSAERAEWIRTQDVNPEHFKDEESVRAYLVGAFRFSAAHLLRLLDDAGITGHQSPTSGAQPLTSEEVSGDQ